MLEEAIAALQLEVDALAGEREGTALWYTRQAKSLGLSFLKRCAQVGINDPIILNATRKAVRREAVKADAADPEYEAALQQAAIAR